MKGKRLTALVLCLVLLCSMLGVAAYADDTAGETEEAEPVNESYEITLQRGFEAYPADTTVLSVNGIEVSWAEYYYFLADAIIYDYLYYMGALPSDYDMLIAENMTIGDFFRTEVLQKVEYFSLAQSRFEEMGLSLTEEEETALAEIWTTMLENYGGEEELAQALRENFLTRESYLSLIRHNSELAALMEELYGASGEKLADEEITAWGTEKGYVRIKHILLNYSEENREEAAAQAEALVEEFRELQGDAAALEEYFSTKMQELSGDKGGLVSFPDGYTFIAGSNTMVTEFEDAAAALEEYTVSDPVNTDTFSGIFILLRLPLDAELSTMDKDSNTGSYLTLREDAANDLFSQDILGWLDEAEVVWNEPFEELDLNTLLEVRKAEAGESVEEPVQPGTEESPAEENNSKAGTAVMGIGAAAVVAVFVILWLLWKTVAGSEPVKNSQEETAPEKKEE